ncbi:MAG TPA: DUF4402 domain-containing protein [Balneolaceae bacterium]|nr:DUF4402 domain-containing protein [Balneolaceae bacterium]
MKQLLTIALCIYGLSATAPSVAKAQSKTNDVSINVSTKVISSIEMITIQSMSLSKANMRNDRITIDPQTSSNAGKMIATGTPNADIRISFLRQRELTQSKGAKTLIFNYRVAGNSKDDQSTAEMLNRENRDFKFNSNGHFYLWIGGSVDISSATPGNYQGEFTVDVEYI